MLFTVVIQKGKLGSLPSVLGTTETQRLSPKHGPTEAHP